MQSERQDGQAVMLGWMMYLPIMLIVSICQIQSLICLPEQLILQTHCVPARIIPEIVMMVAHHSTVTVLAGLVPVDIN